MMTPTHVLMGSGLLSRRGNAAVNWAAALGGLLPDVPMFILFAWDRFLMGLPQREIWRERYWTDDWQIPTAISHSFPIFAVVLVVGLWLKRDWLAVFGGSVLLHSAADFATHHDDAHMSFWPLSRWKFESPFSYWDRQHYGAYVSMVEWAIALAMIALIWRRFPSLWVRVLCGLALALFVAVPLYFRLTLGGGGGHPPGEH